MLALSACKSGAKIQDGETAYRYKKYTLASEMLQKDFDKAKTATEKSNIALKIADSYDKQLDFKNAEIWYKKIADMRVVNDAVLLYVNALKRNEKYQDAFNTLDTYLKANKTEKFRLQKDLDFLQKTLEDLKDTSLTRLTNLSFNSSSLDFAPFLHQNTLYYTSAKMSTNAQKDEWTGDYYTDIYSTQKINTTTFSDAKLLPAPINSEFHDAEFILTKDGKTAYFTRCLSKDKTSNAYCHIYSSTKKADDTWSEPKRLQLMPDTVNEGQPVLSPDENELYFVSDSRDGYGGIDIYLAKKNKEGIFEYPVNAGSRVNTNGDELFPVIANDTTLYFSSNGRIGYGGLDIYSATKQGKIYSNVENLGLGINSGADDFGMILTPSDDDSVLLSGYLSSNRKGGNGSDDIYYFEKRMAPPKPLPPAVFVLNVHVQSKIFQDKNNPNSTYLGVEPIEQATIEMPRFDQVAIATQTLTTDKNGNAQTFIPSNQNFSIKISKTDFLTVSENITSDLPAKNGDTIYINRTITLDKIYKDVEITLNNIYYDYDKWNIRKDAAQSLDTLVDILQKNPSINIQLSAHTDCRGSEQYNKNLSQKRAESVVEYLISKGINANRLTAKGYGESMPIENCVCERCTDEQHQKNRRTTFKIISQSK